MTAPALIPPLDPDQLGATVATMSALAPRYDRTGELPTEGLRAVHDAGLLTATVAPALGGAGWTPGQVARAAYELGRADPSVTLIALQTILMHALQTERPTWPESLYAQVLRDSAVRPVLINALRVEPALGAPARGGLPATYAEKVDGGWLLTGRKTFSTGGAALDYQVVWAATTETTPQLGNFIVTGGSEGVEIVETWDHLGLRASNSHDVVYTRVFVPDLHFIEREVLTKTSKQDNSVDARWGAAIPALYIGVARAAQDFFHRFAHERVPTALGRPIATTERIRTVAGEIELQIAQAEDVMHRFFDRVEAGDPSVLAQAALVKTIIARSAIGAVQTAVAALGNPALSRNNPLERHLRNVLCARVHSPQDDFTLLMTGTQALRAWEEAHRDDHR